MSDMEPKDYVTLIGIGITLVVSLLSLYVGLRNSKKTLYINSVTSSRIKWIDIVRNNISEFCGLSYHYAITKLNEKEKQQLLEKIDRLRFLILLQLNREDKFDQKIIERIEFIPTLIGSPGEIDSIKLMKLQAEINHLIELTQDLLKLEWEGVKRESTQGMLSKKEKDNLYEKYLKTKK